MDDCQIHARENPKYNLTMNNEQIHRIIALARFGYANVGYG
jgi:hypothetical protein